MNKLNLLLKINISLEFSVTKAFRAKERYNNRSSAFRFALEVLETLLLHRCPQATHTETKDAKEVGTVVSLFSYSFFTFLFTGIFVNDDLKGHYSLQIVPC